MSNSDVDRSIQKRVIRSTTDEIAHLRSIEISSRISDTQFMVEIDAYGARQQPSNIDSWHFNYGLA